MNKEKYWISSFRKLDVDDFFIMACMGEGMRTSQIAPLMNSDINNIRKRIKKIKAALPAVYEKVDTPVSPPFKNYSFGKYMLTKQGREVSLYCGRLLDRLSQL
jgi:hypothetical protein